MSISQSTCSQLSLHQQIDANNQVYRTDVDLRRFTSEDRPTSGTSSSPSRSQVTSTISTTSGDTLNNDILTDEEFSASPPPVPVKSHVSSVSDLTMNGLSNTKRKTSNSVTMKPLPPLPPDDYPQVPPRRDSINNLGEPLANSQPNPPEVPARRRPPEILPRRSLNQREKSISSVNSEL